MIKVYRFYIPFLALICALHSMVQPLTAQQSNDSDRRATPGPPPGFVPPPPPNFAPPMAPPTGTNQPVRANRRPQPPEAQLLNRDSQLVNSTDPRMQETVGMIRIPEMGTNEVLEMLENFTGKPILRHQSLPNATITFLGQGEMTRGEAITAIESLLALNGIAITPLSEKFLKAVPASIINAQGAPVWEGTTLNAEPTQKIYEKIFDLDFITATEAKGFITPLMSGGSPLEFEKSGIMLVSDALVNLQRIEKILKILDKPSDTKTEILFFELENIGAEDALRRLEKIQQGPLKNRLETNTTFDADDRSNQLIVFTHPYNKEIIESLVDKLDIDVAPVTATKVYSIRYADSTEVVTIIEQIVTGQKNIRNETGDQNTAAARQRAVANRQQNQAARAARAEASNLQFSDFLTIVPDERANTIVASGTENDLSYLDQLIGEIDTLLAQVRIEVVIAEVRLQDNDTRGIDSFGFTYNSASGGNASGDFRVDTGDNNVDQKSASFPGGFYGVTIPGLTWGPDGFGLDFVLNAAKTNSNVSVLSAPTIVTTHNKEAVVSVGTERPVITGSTSTELDSGGRTTRDQVQFKDIKLELKVTPLIGSDGVVQLEIDQQIQNVVGNVDVNGNPQPIVGTRKATSYVSVANNELIVLGGLQSLDSTENDNQMAILGKIPVIGDLFTSHTTEKIRNELLIFIRPNIIRTTDDANADAREQLGVLEGSAVLENYLENGTFREPETEKEEKKSVRRRYAP